MNTSGVRNLARMPAVAREKARLASSLAKASSCAEITGRIARASPRGTSCAGAGAAQSERTRAITARGGMLLPVRVFLQELQHRDLVAAQGRAQIGRAAGR